MSETTTTVETPAGKSVKPTNGKATPRAERTEVQRQRVELVRVLRKSNATSMTSGKPLGDIAERLKVERKDVYHLVNGSAGKAGSSPTCLVATGHVKVTAREDAGLVAFLTRKGQTTDFSESPFAR